MRDKDWIVLFYFAVVVWGGCAHVRLWVFVCFNLFYFVTMLLLMLIMSRVMSS